jgi:hypothetical protein
VRGYGLADSTPQQVKPNATNVTLRAAAAATPQEAAKVYPGNYWRYPGISGAHGPRQESTLVLHHRGLQGARARVRSARRGHRHQRRGVDGAGRRSHLASFERRKCKVLTGARKADGSECPEGWTLYQTTGPKLKGTNIPADFHYYNWVDQHNILGLGANMPMATGSNSDSLLVLDPQTGKWTTLRVPYPLGFYSRGMDGRIDDARAGWKGKALYANYGTHFVWHIEGGKGTKGKLVHFQMRPDPLAR